jgi:hypothetical protein
MGPKFSGAPTLLASNFWAGDPDPGPFGVRPGPRKMGFTGNLSPPGVLGWRGRDAPLWKEEDEADNLLGAEF